MVRLLSVVRAPLVMLCLAVQAGCGGGGGSSAGDAATPAARPAAGITRLDIAIDEPAFEGRSFGNVGPYRRLRGKAYAELDPADSRNAVIADLAMAPRNARGYIEYAFDFEILRPQDAARGNHKLFFEVNNRGDKMFAGLNQSGGGNDPRVAADAGRAFLLQQGYTLAWSGWDPSATAVNNKLTINLPVARGADGGSVTGQSYEYYSFETSDVQVAGLTYATASSDKTRAVLTYRRHLGDAAAVVPAEGWAYEGEKAFRLLPAGTAFEADAIYEFTYEARDPIVGGIGFAATRDFVSLLRQSRANAAGVSNPLGGDITRVLGFAVSQPARYLNDFIWLGFNEGERGARIFDGWLGWLGSAGGVVLNYRFAQPGRTERLRMNHLYPEGRFPFAWSTTTDPFSGAVDGRLRRCTATNTCPKVMVANSANEYWAKAASLGHTDGMGNDLPDPDNVRFYLMAGVEHTVLGAEPNSTGECAQPRSTVAADSALRALFTALDAWVDGTEPPPSAVPRRADGSAALSTKPMGTPVGVGRVSQSELGWPRIPGVMYTGWVTVRELLDFGPQFGQGVLSLQPPTSTGKVYPSFVSRVDGDGNEVAGIRLPPVAAPLATFSGWAVRAAAFGGPDGCEGSGQTLSFASTSLARGGAGDPRPSLAERFGDHDGYVAAVTTAARQLQARRLLLAVDADAYIDAARTSRVLQP
jgi:hypothetical protein